MTISEVWVDLMTRIHQKRLPCHEVVRSLARQAQEPYGGRICIWLLRL